MIAEAWARRRYEGIHQQDWWSNRRSERDTILDFDARYQAIGGMLSRMIDRADDFCKHGPATDYRSIVRDDGEPLFTDH